MNEDKIQRVLLYAKHALENGTPLTIRDIASLVRVPQWRLIDFINESPMLRYWTVDRDGRTIKRQGLFLVEYIPHDELVTLGE